MFNYRVFNFSLVIFVLLCAVTTVLAQTTEQPTEQGQYTIRIGDVLDITVEGYPEYSKARTVRVDGKISYPIAGEIEAAGKTTSELESILSKKLSGRLSITRNIYVNILQFKQNSIYVLGAVKLSDRYYFEDEEIYFLKALALAGGVVYEKADLKNIQIWRDGDIIRTVGYDELRNESGKKDFKLQPNDTILVPSLLKQIPIYVTGAVLAPDQFPITSDRIHVLKALRLAGGPILETADLENALVIRVDGSNHEVNLKQPQRAVFTDDSLFLYPGDMLHIPNAYEEEKISIIGAVAKPGQYPIKEPIDMIEAISLAGGWSEDIANLKKARIMREDGLKEDVNLLEIIETGNAESGPKLNPGDTLQIPKRIRINWSALLTVTSIASLIYNIVR